MKYISPLLVARYGKHEQTAAKPAHPSLRLHPLRGKHHGLHSVSINLTYRITLALLIQDLKIIPVNVGGSTTTSKTALHQARDFNL